MKANCMNSLNPIPLSRDTFILLYSPTVDLNKLVKMTNFQKKKLAKRILKNLLNSWS